ncbi:MAG: tRNA guanosine(34) transglycosylase Tgt [Hyphomicrobiales bacterium]|nr:tRNA guanosine(34) transglycosylase Tgt [Hyphomicrobiales bacterium]
MGRDRRGDGGAPERRARGGRTHRGGGHHQCAPARESRRRGGTGPRVFRRHVDLHRAGPTLPGDRRADDELPPAALDAVHAGVRAVRRRGDAAGLRARHRVWLSLLQLRRRLPAVSPGAAAVSARVEFAIGARDGAARTGELRLARGTVRTPAFMPVGTAATVKAMRPADVRATGADIVLGNVYHLMLRPGAERVARLGGLHKFMGWDRPILTDSGGFQVMSLAKLRKLDERGVTFRSHLDGSLHELTPERSLEIQALLGADVRMQLDECVALPASPDQTRRAMELSLRWAERSKAAFAAAPGAALFGIVQGGADPRLREESADALGAIGFDGYAIGGLAVGEPQAVMLDMIEATAPRLPDGRPRYLMGVGTPDDLLEAVARGIDMFDCVMPTRAGRHGQAFTWAGRMNLRNARFADDPRPLDEASDCAAARDWSRAYLHHLVKAGEILGMMLLTEINVAFYQSLMARMRDAIANGRLETLRAELKPILTGRAGGDEGK